MKAPITFLQGIVIAIVLPIILLIVFIFFSNYNTFGLVEKDYYQKGVDYQSQIDMKSRTDQLLHQINIYNDDEGVVLHFPKVFSFDEISGIVHFFRPSDPNQDYSVEINLNIDGLQSIGTADIQKGAWIVKVFWNHQKNEYYSEKRIFVD